jgi:hypothetical protein
MGFPECSHCPLGQTARQLWLAALRIAGDERVGYLSKPSLGLVPVREARRRQRVGLPLQRPSVAPRAGEGALLVGFSERFKEAHGSP